MPSVNSNETTESTHGFKVFKYAEQQPITLEDQEDFAAINISFEPQKDNPHNRIA